MRMSLTDKCVIWGSLSSSCHGVPDTVPAMEPSSIKHIDVTAANRYPCESNHMRAFPESLNAIPSSE